MQQRRWQAQQKEWETFKKQQSRLKSVLPSGGVGENYLRWNYARRPKPFLDENQAGVQFSPFAAMQLVLLFLMMGLSVYFVLYPHFKHDRVIGEKDTGDVIEMLVATKNPSLMAGGESLSLAREAEPMSVDIVPGTNTPTPTATNVIEYFEVEVPEEVLSNLKSLTPTSTLGPTNTLTPSPTATSTTSLTPSPTATLSPSNTPHVIYVVRTVIVPATVLVYVEVTPTYTPSPTPTHTLTPTITHTPSPTFNPTFTLSPTATFTPTLSYTPTFTPTTVYTPNLTPTFTPTFTSTMTITP